MTKLPTSDDRLQHPSRDLVRALDHLGALERGEMEERYGVAPSLFAQFGLFPLTAPDETAPMWKRSSPFGEVVILRGAWMDATGSHYLTRYPSGGIPRLFLVDLATEVRNAARQGREHPEVVELTDTLNRYTTQRLGLRKGSRNRAVLEQVLATARATITFTRVEYDAEKGMRRASGRDAKVADGFDLWLPEQDTLAGFEPTITLSHGFMQLVLGGQNVPVRRDLLAQLAGKPMAFDVLLWLGSITYWLHRSGKREAFYDWPYLFATFTHDYARLDNFTINWKAALAEAMRYYPEGRVEVVRGTRAKPGGIRVSRSPLLIEPKRGD